jgi:hypothetical protein
MSWYIDLEQNNQAWSVRVFNFSLAEEEERDGRPTRDNVDDLAFLPFHIR